jgi:hypothetical protein
MSPQQARWDSVDARHSYPDQPTPVPPAETKKAHTQEEELDCFDKAIRSFDNAVREFENRKS